LGGKRNSEKGREGREREGEREREERWGSVWKVGRWCVCVCVEMGKGEKRIGKERKGTKMADRERVCV
jgi:hypothetical protein